MAEGAVNGEPDYPGPGKSSGNGGRAFGEPLLQEEVIPDLSLLPRLEEAAAVGGPEVEEDIPRDRAVIGDHPDDRPGLLDQISGEMDKVQAGQEVDRERGPADEETPLPERKVRVFQVEEQEIILFPRRGEVEFDDSLSDEERAARLEELQKELLTEEDVRRMSAREAAERLDKLTPADIAEQVRAEREGEIELDWSAPEQQGANIGVEEPESQAR